LEIEVRPRLRYPAPVLVLGIAGLVTRSTFAEVPSAALNHPAAAFRRVAIWQVKP